MKEMYEIVVVGESMAGKSTWISSLINEELGKRLKSICGSNKMGQTKIATNYILEKPDTKPAVTGISWILDEIADEKNKEALGLLSGYFPVLENAEDPEKEFYEFIASQGHKEILEGLDLFDFMENVINNKVISSSGLIQAADIVVPAEAKVWEVLVKYGQNRVKVKDTRGFIDETPEDMARMYEEIAKRHRGIAAADKSKEEKWLIDKLFNERGMAGADGIVFLGIENSNALLKENNREIYGGLITKMLNSAPVFLTVRSDGLSGLYEENEETDYKEALSKDGNGKYKYIKRFDGFKNYRELFRSFEDGNEDDVKANIAKKHYKELLLPKVIVDDDIEKWERIYRKASVAVFDEVIAEAHAFNERYEEVQNIAGKLLDVLNLNMTDLFKSTFNEIFKSYIEQIGTCFYIKGIYENDNTILRRLSGGFCGGLVGVRGGLTTPDKNYGGMVGDVAVDIMETAYRLRYDLYGKIIKDIEPFITGYAGKIHNSESEIEKEKTRLLNLFRERFDREANFNTFSRYCTYTMLNQSFLETAFCKEEAKWRLRGAKSIEGCLPELEDMYLGDNWARSRNLISVLKDILWDMIEESIKIRNN